MQRQKTQWRANHGARALKTVAAIQASIERLNDEDLLDFHDIFGGMAGTPLADLAATEVAKRDLA